MISTSQNGQNSTFDVGLFIEKRHPIVLSILTVIIWHFFGLQFPNNTESLFGTAAGVAAVFASFLGVAQSIILSIKNTEGFRVIESLGFDKLLYGYLGSGIHSSAMLAIISVIGFFISKTFEIRGYHIWDAYILAWVFLASYASLAYARVSRLLFKLMSQKLDS